MSPEKLSWHKQNPEKANLIFAKYDAKRRTPARLQYKRDRVMYVKYGLSPNDYNLLLAQQSNSCKICGVAAEDAPLNGGGKQARPLVIDHCHTTNKVRGLLCVKCNSGLGMFNDSQTRLASAISYLRENS